MNQTTSAPASNKAENFATARNLLKELETRFPVFKDAVPLGILSTDESCTLNPSDDQTYGAKWLTDVEATYNLGEGLTLKGGRFYSGVGYLNSQHAHRWDFVDNPLAYQAFLGQQLSAATMASLFAQSGGAERAAGAYLVALADTFYASITILGAARLAPAPAS